MEKHYEMIAIQRRAGRILLITLDGSKEFPVSEINLNSFGISLGEMANVIMDNDIPMKFKKTNNIYNLKSEVLGPNVIIKGFYARIMSDNNRFFFHSPIFGKMNSTLAISPELRGTSQLVVIGYRKEDDRCDEMPFVWNAYIDQNPVVKGGPSSSRSPPRKDDFYVGGSSVHRLVKKFESTPDIYKNSQSSSSGHRYSSEDVPRLENKKACATRTVDGIVVAKNEKENFCYVWTKESYPGRDAKLYTTSEFDLNVSDWVQMHLTDEEDERYFPFEPTSDTPQFECRSFTTMKARLTTVPTKSNNSVMVTIPTFLKSGDILRNHLLGLLIDHEKLLKEDGNYEITVKRGRPSKISNGESSVWYITAARKHGSGSAVSKNHHNSVDSSSSSNLYKSMQDLSMAHVRHPSEESQKFSIDGIVVVKSETYDWYYVWAKECYPGKVVKLWNNMGVALMVSDWVQMEITKSDFERCFPSEPTPKTPQFECRSFTRIVPLL